MPTPQNLAESIDALAEGVRHLSRGDAAHGPLGIEALVMTLAGPGGPGHRPIVDAIDSHTAAVNSVAEAIHDLANAVRSIKP